MRSSQPDDLTNLTRRDKLHLKENVWRRAWRDFSTSRRMPKIRKSKWESFAQHEGLRRSRSFKIGMRSQKTPTSPKVSEEDKYGVPDTSASVEEKIKKNTSVA